MELHPILEAGDNPSHGMWYVLSARGEAPSMRVGHTCVFVVSNKESGPKLLIIGGANPSGSFAETYLLDFDKYEWDIPEWKGLQARYEHTAFLTNKSVYVFGGAEITGNLNSIQKLDLDTEIWTTPVISGTPPSPRTCHAHATADGMMYVFGGGETGAEPVIDRRVHVFDSSTLTWSQPKTNGKPPKARHGHVMVVVGNKLFVHGGMSQNTFFDNLHELHLKTMTWKQVRCKGDIPSGRAAHSAVAYGNHIIISCGMNQNGAMDDLYSFNTDTLRWIKLNMEGPPPSCRLDHSMCIIEWNYMNKKRGTELEHSIMNQVESDVHTIAPQIQELKLSDGNINMEKRNDNTANSTAVVTECVKESATTAKDVLVSGGVGISEGVSNEATETVDLHSPMSTSFIANKNNDSEQTVEGAVGGEANSQREVKVSMSDSLDESCTLLLMYGGMDTNGEIFDDTLVLRINLSS